MFGGKSTFFQQDGCRRALTGERVMFATLDPKKTIDQLKDYFPNNVLYEITSLGEGLSGVVPIIRRGR